MESHRFVVLLHQLVEESHWDVMLETDSALAVWSIPPQVLTGSSFVCQAKQLPDHRKHYLDYEGIISGNRGTVSRIDAGTYHQTLSGQFVLQGTIFAGKMTIEEAMLKFEPSV